MAECTVHRQAETASVTVAYQALGWSADALGWLGQAETAATIERYGRVPAGGIPALAKAARR
jgi:hypothetical protein